jgi:arylsulfatase A-like enzyme
MRFRFYSSLAFIVFLLNSCADKTPPPPNILFILVDDLGYADLGYSGSPFHDTPNIDRLAAASWSFTQGHSGSRVCSPARASIMTGQFTARHGITDWIGAKSGEDWRSHGRHDPMLPADYAWNLAESHTTLAEAFKEHGYSTFYAGKWHLGDEGSFPEDHGFDTNIAGWDKGSPVGGFFSPYQNPKIEDGPQGENLTMRLAEETANFIEKHQEGPFFAYLSFYAVHAPIQTTQLKWKKYRDKAHDMGIAPSGFEMGEKIPYRTVQDNPIYAGLVESVDDAVGLVIEKLEALGLDENTIVVLTSDNGGVVAGDAFATDNIKVKGGKGQHWEGGTRVPYLIKAPGISPQESDYPVTGADFFPTLLHLAGFPPLSEQHVDGTSLFPLMKGEELPERGLYWHYPHYGNQGGVPSSVVRRGDYKLIHYWESGRDELYHLGEDPFEEEDIARQQPQVVTALTQELEIFLQECQALLPVRDPEFEPQKYKARLVDMEERFLPELERRRMQQFDPEWQPNEDWWGSQPLTVD